MPNYHENSDEYKQLGTLHRENRIFKYFPQDEKDEFSSKPQILGKEYELAAKRDQIDKNKQAASIAPEHPLSRSIPGATGFPKTTNQDFHGGEVFHKSVSFGPQIDK